MSKHSAGSKLFDLCLTLLLGAMALYGAVVILRAVWVPVCIALAVTGAVWLLVTRRTGRW